MRYTLGLAFVLAATLAACGGTPSSSRTPGALSRRGGASAIAPLGPVPPEDPPTARLPADLVPTRYTLALQVVPDRERFAGTVDIAVRLTRPRAVIWLHGQELNVTSAVVELEGGARVAARWEPVGSEGLGALRFPRPLPSGPATVHLAYDAPFNGRLQGHFRVTAGGQRYAFTKFEPLAARLAFPCFDEPGFKTPFDITLTVPRAHVALSNTHTVEDVAAADGMRRVRFATTQPLPTYLVAWAVGPFDVVETTLPPTGVRTRPLPVRGVATHGRGGELAYALGRVRELVEALETYFGSEYPFDKLDLVAAPEYPAGAMENAGAIMFREAYLLLNAQTASEQQRRNLTLTIAHELAHQWAGNMVTMAWWDDLWLNEAFAEWVSRRVVAERAPNDHLEAEQLRDIQSAMEADSLTTARQIRQPIASIHDVRNAFDYITYVKGTAVLAMFERWIGREAFQRGVRAYLVAHRWGNATADDLLAALSEASGRDVATPFRTFLQQSGVPMLDARVACDAGAAHLALRQSRYAQVGSTAERGRTWQIPVCARYGAGPAGEAREACTLLTAAEGQLALPGATCGTWVFPNADGAGYYRWSLPAADLERLRTTGWGHLTALDRLTLAGALQAGFDSGAIPAAEAYASLSLFAADPDRLLAVTPTEMTRFARTYVVDAASRPRVEAFARQLYGPVLQQLGMAPRPGATSDGDTALRRRDLMTFMANVGRDPAVRHELTLRGRAVLGLDGDGQLHPEEVSADLLGLALTVTVQDGDAAVFDAVLARVQTTQDAVLRDQMLRALGSTRAESLAARARNLALTPTVRGTEVLGLLTAQFAGPETRDAAWQWLRDHVADVATRLPAQQAQYISNLPRTFCDAARADEVRTFLAPRVEGFVGAPRNLASTAEAIRLCAARVAAQRGSARAFFSRVRR